MATIKNGVVFINGAGAFAREVPYVGFGSQSMTLALSMDVNEATVFSSVASATKEHPSLKAWQTLQAVEERTVKLQCWKDEKDA